MSVDREREEERKSVLTMVSTNVWTNFNLTLLVCNFEHCNVVIFNFSHVWAAKMAGMVVVGNTNYLLTPNSS